MSPPPPPPTTLLLLLIIFIFTEFSASAPDNLGRRILHQQPFVQQSDNSSASPPAPPPTPPVPFTTAASPPSATPFFPSLPSSPPPPLSNFASFPANVTPLGVSKPHSSSSPKLLILTVLLLLLALFLSFFAVYFFIYKKRRQSGCFTKDGKATDHSSTSSSKQQQQQSRNHGNSRRTNPDSNVTSRTSSEFLYLGTLVNNQNSRGHDNPRLIVNKSILNVHSSNASSHNASSRKWDSPDLNPLPPLSRNTNIPINTEVGSSCHTFVVSNNSNVSNTSSRYDAEEEFYSPRGSLGGGGDSVETRSSSRRDLNAVDNFDGKKFSSSSSRSSSSSSSSGSPARSVSISISPPVSLSPIRPKSPELVEMDVLLARPPLMQPQQEQSTFMVGLVSASDDDGASLSSLNSKRSALDSARTSNQSDGNVVVELNGFQNRLDCDSKSSSFSSAEKDPVDRLSGLDGNVRSQAQMPQPLMPQLGCDSKSSSSSSPERDPVVSLIGSSDDNERSQGTMLLPLMTQLEDDRETSFSFSPEREVNELPKIPDASDHIHNVMTQAQVLESHSKLSFTLSPDRNHIEPPRTSNASDYHVQSPSRIPSPDGKPLISLSPERNHIELSRISDVSGHHVKSVRSPSRTSDSNHQHRQPIPLPPPLPPPFLAGRQSESHTPSPSPNATTPLGRPPALITPSRPFEVHSPSEISPFELPTPNCKTAEKTEGTINIKTSETGEETSNFETPEKDTDAVKHESLEKSGHTPKPKLKTLHWDKVKANSDREMVWDQLKCSSFKLNEEMIETLFVVNNKSPNPKEVAGHPVFPSLKQESNRVLDPKKSQNIAISLRALNVTIEEVHEALVEGNVDLLGTELLESLQKMVPTKEEERKLKEYSDALPFKLGPAERFLKAVLDIPFAFKRVDAMLYVANFDSEVEYLKKSFQTLEAACEELRNSRMFLKLLEAVLKTGNRMNVGTNRGDAHAFKLDMLLKLVDVKGADGKTTLLHFVVQEIIKAEGARLSTVNQGLMSAFNEDAKCRKLGLQVVSSLSSDLSNVKKAAAMDSDVLSSEVTKLSRGIEHIREIVQLNKTNEKEENDSKFAESMDKFIITAEEEIIRIQAQESVALSLVKEITEYFHGNSAKEEAHPFRIFMVVRDFLSILGGVCKEVGTINERTMISSAHKFPVPVNPMLPATLHGIPAKQQFSSPYNYDSSSP